MRKDKHIVSIIRSSAAEYLTFIAAIGESDVNAIYCDEDVWLTQKMIGLLFDVAPAQSATTSKGFLLMKKSTKVQLLENFE